jgi:hypothetical protein
VTPAWTVGTLSAGTPRVCSTFRQQAARKSPVSYRGQNYLEKTMTQKTQTKAEVVASKEQYVAFLRKRLDSENYKSAVTAEEYVLTQAKYDKAKFLLKMLKMA